jgi:hypothetical protein
MLKELLSTVNFPDVAAGGLIAGTVVWLARNPRTVMNAAKWLVGREGRTGADVSNSHTGRDDDTKSLTIGKHAEICSNTIAPIREDVSAIKIKTVEISTDVTWIKQRLVNGENDFRDLHRKIDSFMRG